MVSLWKKIWPELKAYRKQLLWVILLGALTSGLKGVVPELFKRLYASWQDKDTNTALIITGGLTLCWILASVARFYHLSIMKYSADCISVNQRRLLMDKYLSLNLSFFQDLERGSGGLISRMLNDITVIQTGIHKIADVFREPLLAIGMLCYLLYLDWQLTLFILIALPIVTSILRRLARSLRKYSRVNQEIMEDLTRTLKESLDGTKIVQSFSLENEIRRKFNMQADNFLATRRKIIRREEAAGPISESLTVIFIALCLLYLGNRFINSSFQTEDFLGFMFAMGLLQDSIRKLQDGYIKMQQAAVGLDRFHAILGSNPSVRSPDNPVPFPLDWKTIEFQNVSFAYNNECVLKNIDLVIDRSETVALVGSSGSGKSTLVNLLQRFFDPTEGQILIGGVPIKNLDLNELRKNIAIVTQDVFLFNDTIEKNIHMGNLSAPIENIANTAKLANAHDFIEKSPMGYQTSVGDFGSRMSGGEKQRISIARAILKDAPILVLDEATSALDSESELEVQKGLNQLLHGRTAFVIAHRLSTIAKATRIIVLKSGQIVEEGSHNLLIEKKGEYFKFHQMQFALS